MIIQMHHLEARNGAVLILVSDLREGFHGLGIWFGNGPIIQDDHALCCCFQLRLPLQPPYPRLVKASPWVALLSHKAVERPLVEMIFDHLAEASPPKRWAMRRSEAAPTNGPTVLAKLKLGALFSSLP